MTDVWDPISAPDPGSSTGVTDIDTRDDANNIRIHGGPYVPPSGWGLAVAQDESANLALRMVAVDGGGAAGEFFAVQGPGGFPVMFDCGTGAVIGLRDAPISDAALNDLDQNWGGGGGVVQMWLDAAGNKLMFRVAYPDGTTHKAGSVTLA